MWGRFLLSMKTYKVILTLASLLIAIVATYVSFIYVYTDHMFTPPTLLTTPNLSAPSSAWTAGDKPYIHKVNTPQRARNKNRSYGGFEVDIWVDGGELLAAHDEQEASRKIKLTDIFDAIDNPQDKSWWFDLKQPLTKDTLSKILQTTQRYHIPDDNLLFETAPNEGAKLVKQANLGLLLPLPEGFEEDFGNTQTRAQLNAQVLALWQEYQPAAVSASFGKYVYLKAYFPQMPKAIYYSSTKRPSLKKFLMRKYLQKDPAVKIFMTDEYNWISL